MSISIMIVDDDELDRYIVRRVAKISDIDGKVIEYKAGDEFIDAIVVSGRRARDMGVDEPPALVLLDINMPRMNGFQVLEEIQRKLDEQVIDPNQFVILMFSSSNHVNDKKEVFSYPFVKDYIVKPLTVETLQALVEKYHADTH